MHPAGVQNLKKLKNQVSVVDFACSQDLIEHCTNISKVKCHKEIGHLQSACQLSF